MADKPTSPVQVTREGKVVVVTIDAPKFRNSMGAPGVREGLNEAVRTFESDAELAVMILTGSDGVFSAGGNLRVLLEMRDPMQLQARLESGKYLTQTILSSDKLYIAAVEGPAFGAGLGLALACDLVVASETARFCAAQIRVGASPDGSLFWTLPRRCSNAIAKRMLLCGDEMTMPEALQAGMADYSAPKDTALKQALIVAKRLANGPKLAQATVKQFFALDMIGRDTVLDWERQTAVKNFMTNDFVEGATAFLEKRKPQFRGT